MLHNSALVLTLYIREGMSAAFVAKQKAVALRMVSGILRSRHNLYQTPVTVLAVTCRDTLAYNAAAGILANMNHLCSGIGLLIVVCYSHRVELGEGVVSLKYCTRIFPGNGRTCLHLSPEEFGVLSLAYSSLGYKVIYAASALFVARIPVLHGRVFNLCILHYHNLHNCGVQLTLAALRSRTALQVAHV